MKIQSTLSMLLLLSAAALPQTACDSINKVRVATGNSTVGGGSRGERGEKGERGDKGDQGLQGESGPTGQDGSLRIYGDGSAGDLSISGTVTWDIEGPINTQFKNFTNEGTLTVPSGTVIRCQGTFTNRGTLTVTTAGMGGVVSMTGNNAIMLSPPSLGLSRRLPLTGEIRGAGSSVWGGFGGIGLSPSLAKNLLHPGIWGGGGGSGSINGVGDQGGGSLVVLARQDIINTGTINANAGNAAGNGSGGGGGGIIILASPTLVNNNEGILNANGGKGGDAFGMAGNGSGNGGGGGGGIIHLLGQSVVTTTGSISVAGGKSGRIDTKLTEAIIGGGSGGGACGGNGARGGAVLMDGTLNNMALGDGEPGIVIKTSGIDPTALF